MKGRRLEVESLMSGEDELIAWLRRSSGPDAEGLIGDDAAVLPEDWAVTTDTQIEGVHFVPGLDPALIARRLLAVNLSDLAAMGSRPAYAFLALAAPSGFDHRRFFTALLRSAARYGLTLAGGDLAASPALTAVLTLLGSREGRWLRRAGASAGEKLWLGGSVGESAAGAVLVGQGARLDRGEVRLPAGFEASRAVLAAARRAVRRHLAPRPQIELGRWLATATEAGAALDVSDGLALDLHRLCRESRVGAEVLLDRIPRPSGSRELAERLSLDFRDLALAGGEDYVLLFTLPEGVEPPAEHGCRAIGRIVAGRRMTLISKAGREELSPRGWDHLATRK